MANTYSIDLESGSSQDLSIANGDQTGLALTTDFTFEAWVKWESIPSSGNQMFIYQKEQTTNYRWWWALRNYSGTYAINLGVSSGSAEDTLRVDFLTAPSTGVWYHYAITWDESAGQCEFFVDGVSQGTDSGSITSLAANTGTFIIGSNGSSNSYVDGKIDEARVWSDIRTDAEIVDYAAQELVGNEANLIACWQFNNDATDLTANNNDLTANNGPVYSTDVAFYEDVASSAMSTDIISYWKLDETSGTRVDSTVTGNDLTDNNTVLYGTGVIGNAADLERSNSEYLSISNGDQSGLDLAGDWSVSLWYKPETVTGGNETYIFAATKPNASQAGFQFYLGQGNKLSAEYWSGTTTANLSRWEESSTTLSAGNWYHLVMAVDVSAKVFKLYVNGQPIAGSNSWSNASVVLPAGGGFGLGGSPDGANYTDGLIDEACVLSRVLTSGEVLNLYNGGAGIPYASSTDYPMTAALGEFTLTGKTSNLLIGIKMTAALGTFTLSGIASVLNIGRKMAAALGTFTLTGIDVTLLGGKRLVAALGQFTLTGNDVIFRNSLTLIASAGSFAWTGFAASLSTGYAILASLGTFTLTGVSSTFRIGRLMTAALGEFTLTGIAAAFYVGKKLVAEAGSFVLTGLASGLKLGWHMTAALGEFTLTGVAAILRYGYGIVAAAGTFTLTGVAATFHLAWKMAAATGVFTLTSIATRLYKKGWSALSKTASSWTSNSKTASSWTENNKS